MVYDFEYIIKYGKHIPVACALYNKSDHPDRLEFKLEYHVVADSVD